MRYIILSLLILSSLFGESRCLIVGIGHYQSNKVPDIRGVDNDVKKLKDIAKNVMGFDPSQVKVLQNSEATKNNILENLQNWLVDGVTENDVIMFAYSGHGTQVKDKNGDEDDGLDEAIVPYDTRTYHDLIIDDQLSEILSRSRAKLKIYYLDSCHSGTGMKAIFNYPIKYLNPEKLGEYLTPKGLMSLKSIGVFEGSSTTEKSITLTAAAANEVSYGALGDGIDASVFTYVFYKGVMERKADNNHDGRITFFEAWDYTSNYIRNDISRRFDNLTQTPQLEPLPESLKYVVIENVAQGPTESTGSSSILDSASTYEQLFNSLLARSNNAVVISSDRESYEIGDPIRLTVKSPFDGYIYMVAINPDSSVVMLMPNRYFKDNRIEANEEIVFPNSSPYKFRATPPAGTSKVYVFVSDERVPELDRIFNEEVNSNTSQKFAIVRNADFKKVKKSIKGLRSISVEPDRKNRNFAGDKIDVIVKGG